MKESQILAAESSVPAEWPFAVMAHGYSEESSEYVFSMLMEGEPCFEMDVVRIPRDLVDTIRGG